MKKSTLIITKSASIYGKKPVGIFHLLDEPQCFWEATRKSTTILS